MPVPFNPAIVARPVPVRSNTIYTLGVTCADWRFVLPSTGCSRVPAVSLTACSFFNASRKARNCPDHGEVCESNRFCTTHSIGSFLSYPVAPAAVNAAPIASVRLALVARSYPVISVPSVVAYV